MIYCSSEEMYRIMNENGYGEFSSVIAAFFEDMSKDIVTDSEASETSETKIKSFGFEGIEVEYAIGSNQITIYPKMSVVIGSRDENVDALEALKRDVSRAIEERKKIEELCEVPND